eukprot:5709333-Alexandrium_andersonii.AAC.1
MSTGAGPGSLATLRRAPLGTPVARPRWPPPIGPLPVWRSGPAGRSAAQPLARQALRATVAPLGRHRRCPQRVVSGVSPRVARAALGAAREASVGVGSWAGAEAPRSVSRGDAGEAPSDAPRESRGPWRAVPDRIF